MKRKRNQNGNRNYVHDQCHCYNEYYLVSSNEQNSNTKKPNQFIWAYHVHVSFPIFDAFEMYNNYDICLAPGKSSAFVSSSVSGQNVTYANPYRFGNTIDLCMS